MQPRIACDDMQLSFGLYAPCFIGGLILFEGLFAVVEIMIVVGTYSRVDDDVCKRICELN